MQVQLQMRLAKAMMALAAHRAMCSQNLGLLALPGQLGMQMLAKTSDATLQRKLEDAVLNLEKKLQLLPEGAHLYCQAVCLNGA